MFSCCPVSSSGTSHAWFVLTCLVRGSGRDFYCFSFSVGLISTLIYKKKLTPLECFRESQLVVHHFLFYNSTRKCRLRKTQALVLVLHTVIKCCVLQQRVATAVLPGGVPDSCFRLPVLYVSCTVLRAEWDSVSHTKLPMDHGLLGTGCRTTHPCSSRHRALGHIARSSNASSGSSWIWLGETALERDGAQLNEKTTETTHEPLSCAFSLLALTRKESDRLD